MPEIFSDLRKASILSFQQKRYLHGGRVMNTTLFDLGKDPLELTNLVQGPQSQALWPYSTLRTWARLVAAERENWPAEAVQARDDRARSDGSEICGEQHRRNKRWRRRRRRKARGR